MINGVKGKDLPNQIFRSLRSCKVLLLACMCAFIVSVPIRAGAENSRTHIKIVGSSIVLPFTQRVAKAFSEQTLHLVPVIKNTGSSSGIAQFCKGIGLKYPDIVNSSRPITKGEWQGCKSNGVDDITEIQFGNDGVTLAKSLFGERMNLTRLQLYKATARRVPVQGRLIDNPYRNWSDIDDNLPDVAIQIFGPTDGHGSYKSFVNAIYLETCKNDLRYFKRKRLALKDPAKFAAFLEANCSQMRFDSAYIGTEQPVAETFKMLKTNVNAMALIDYSDLFNRRSSLQAVRIEGVEPRIYTISDGSYPLSRPLYFYIKNAHRDLVPGLTEFAREFMSDHAMSSFGYLVRMGLGVLSVEDLLHARYAAVIGEKMRRYAE